MWGFSGVCVQGLFAKGFNILYVVVVLISRIRHFFYGHLRRQKGRSCLGLLGGQVVTSSGRFLSLSGVPINDKNGFGVGFFVYLVRRAMFLAVLVLPCWVWHQE